MDQVNLKDLDSGTEFTYNGRKYKKGFMFSQGKVLCEPFLGGKFQSSSKLRVPFPEDTQVEVKA